MKKDELIQEANAILALLETARRIGDYDSAEKLAGSLQHTYRLLVLDKMTEEAENESRIAAP